MTGTGFGRGVPTIVDLQPSGRFLMEEFYYAGGLPVVMKALAETGRLERDALTVTGQSLWENVKHAENFGPEVIRPFANALDIRGRHRRVARQSGAGRRRPETLRRDPGFDEASRARGRLRHDRGLQAPYLRS